MSNGHFIQYPFHSLLPQLAIHYSNLHMEIHHNDSLFSSPMFGAEYHQK